MAGGQQQFGPQVIGRQEDAVGLVDGQDALPGALGDDVAGVTAQRDLLQRQVPHCVRGVPVVGHGAGTSATSG